MAACRTLKISSRRYLGSKYKLLPFIQRIVEEECKNIHVMVDIFSGTGVVASAFQGKNTAVVTDTALERQADADGQKAAQMSGATPMRLVQDLPQQYSAGVLQGNFITD